MNWNALQPAFADEGYVANDDLAMAVHMSMALVAHAA